MVATDAGAGVPITCAGPGITLLSVQAVSVFLVTSSTAAKSVPL